MANFKHTSLMLNTNLPNEKLICPKSLLQIYNGQLKTLGIPEKIFIKRMDCLFTYYMKSFKISFKIFTKNFS